jgi:coenzyme F420-dependent glucose-6-phosphate dehydrogenase
MRLPLVREVRCKRNDATSALIPGRFFLGVGTGENLNEHINARHWPEPPVRLEMLEEAVGAIRKLWSGGFQSVYGKYFSIENARIYPAELTPPDLSCCGSSAGGGTRCPNRRRTHQHGS